MIFSMVKAYCFHRQVEGLTLAWLALTLLEDTIGFTGNNYSHGDSLPKLFIFYLIEMSLHIISDFCMAWNYFFSAFTHWEQGGEMALWGEDLLDKHEELHSNIQKKVNLDRVVVFISVLIQWGGRRNSKRFCFKPGRRWGWMFDCTLTSLGLNICAMACISAHSGPAPTHSK